MNSFIETVQKYVEIATAFGAIARSCSPNFLRTSVAPPQFRRHTTYLHYVHYTYNYSWQYLCRKLESEQLEFQLQAAPMALAANS